MKRKMPTQTTVKAVRRKPVGRKMKFHGEVGDGYAEAFIHPWDKKVDGWPLSMRIAPSNQVRVIGTLDVFALGRLAQLARKELRKVPDTYKPGKKGQLSL